MNKRNKKDQKLSMAQRLLHSFGPLAGGLLLDVVDLATFGPWGFFVGPVIGGLLGWWLAHVYGFGLFGQCAMILVVAVYCTLPATELVPVATFVFALVRFAEKKQRR